MTSGVKPELKVFNQTFRGAWLLSMPSAETEPVITTVDAAEICGVATT
jgi:hypothetical protein